MLGRALRQRSLICLEGVGRHPANQWPGEVSYLILGLTLDAAKTLGTRLEQNAIVWSGADAVPRLILLRLIRGLGRPPGELLQIAPPTHRRTRLNRSEEVGRLGKPSSFSSGEQPCCSTRASPAA